MILYYAMGGGLGHLTRSLAILQETPELIGHVRLMASSKWSALVLSHAPCPIDIVAGEILSSKRKYLQFLHEYIQQYHIKLLILDTFPFGIVGEWLHIGEHIPRILIARYLKWETYFKRVKTCRGQIPSHTLILEPLTKQNLRILKTQGQLTSLDAPIVLHPSASPQGETTSPYPPQGGNSVSHIIEDSSQGGKGGVKYIPGSLNDDYRHKEACLIVHTGNETERQVLIDLSKQEFGKNTIIDCVFPEQEMYPAEEIIPHYKRVVSGAGYNMTAIASQAPAERIHLLHPFKRRFDNQFLRLQRFKEGELWKRQNCNSAQDAAQWLLGVI